MLVLEQRFSIHVSAHTCLISEHQPATCCVWYVTCVIQVDYNWSDACHTKRMKQNKPIPVVFSGKTTYDYDVSGKHETPFRRNFHAVLGQVGPGLNYEELVVYKEEAALPTHLVVYSLH